MLDRATSFLWAAAAALIFVLPAHEAKIAVSLAGGAKLRSGRTPLGERPPEQLLQADAEQALRAATKAGSAGAARHQSKLQQPKGPNWFATFDEGESTYDEQADDGRAHLPDNHIGQVLQGWDPQLPGKQHEQDVKNPEFFDETKSAAYEAAWQTHYPALTGSLATGGASPGEWYQADGGPWQQQYVDSKLLRESYQDGTLIPASWFDSSVSQYDGYGRAKFPSQGTPAEYWDWEERSVNTTLFCKDPGCVANASLQAPFDPSKEEAKLCRLSVFFHPTDFDEYYSGEKVDFVDVNNYRTAACYPMASGCNATAGKRLFPCVSSLDVDQIIEKANNGGKLAVAAKIADVVDECPYKKDANDAGNLLSAVPILTCLVKPIAVAAPAPPEPVMPLRVMEKRSCKQEAPIKCTTRGCSAESVLEVSNFCGQPGNKCKLNLTVYQTDFDEEQGTVEMIEYIKVGGVTVKENVKPGKNPCKPSWLGTPAAEKDLTYLAVENQDVAQNATTGLIKVEGKISDYVDECGYEGYLFHGLITLDCGDVEVGSSLIDCDGSQTSKPVGCDGSQTSKPVASSFLQNPERSVQQLRGSTAR